MVKPKIPCGRNCDKRSTNCHAECTAYEQYKKELYEYNCFVLSEKKKYEDVKAYLVNRKAPSIKTGGTI